MNPLADPSPIRPRSTIRPRSELFNDEPNLKCNPVQNAHLNQSEFEVKHALLN